MKTRRRTNATTPRVRGSTVKRFLFSNGISMLTLLTIAYQAGAIVTRLDTHQASLSRLETQMQDVDRDVTNIREKLAGHDVELQRKRIAP